MSKKVLNNSDFFRMLARRGIEHVHVSEHLDQESQDVLNHIRTSTLEQLSADNESPADDTGEVVTEGAEVI